jgi:hypothetical protein
MIVRIQPCRRGFYASFCLFAAVLLYAPLAEAAWSSYKAACCASDQCPIPGHHHQRAPAAPANHFDCGHEIAPMAACTMSCCQNPDRPVITSVVFVLPARFTLSAPAGFKSAIELLKSLDLPGSIAPLSPPPRIAAVVA